MLVEFDPGYPDWNGLQEVTNSWRRGGVVAIPTDTRYALACSLEHFGAVRRMAEIKKADRSKRFSILFSDMEQVGRYVEGMSSYAYRACRSLLPGPYTLVLPAGREVPKLLHNKQRTVGVRVPDHDLVQALLDALGSPVACTSIPWEVDEQPVQDPREVEAVWGEKVDWVVGQGNLMVQDSTVVDLSVHPPEILREGAGDLGWFLS
jgi:tRNA threonylcarbamoyl adenosine modification protein (Sua5/YciO/YrdC/YwlC family)